jgi:hypothetical protein
MDAATSSAAQQRIIRDQNIRASLRNSGRFIFHSRRKKRLLSHYRGWETKAEYMDGCISPLPVFAAGNQLMVEVSAVRRNKN